MLWEPRMHACGGHELMCAVVMGPFVCAAPICDGQLKSFLVNGTDYTNSSSFETLGSGSTAFKVLLLHA